MADNVTIPATGSGDATPVIASDDIASVHYQKVKLVDGTADSTTAIAAGGGAEAGALLVTIANDSTGLVSVDDNGQALTVDNGGTFAVQDSEKVADNAAFTDGTTPVQPAGFIYDEVAGTALTENDAAAARINANRAQVGVVEDGATRGRWATVSAANALKVDGSAVTQPVSAAALPLPAGAATSALQLADGHNVTVDNTVGSPANVQISDGTETALVDASGRLSVSIDAETAAVTVDQATAASLNAQVVGDIVHDTADGGGNPVKIGGRADSTFQTAVGDGDRVDALFDVYGQLRTRADHANLQSYHEDSSSALTDASVFAAPGAGLSSYVTDITVSTGAATAFNIFFEEGASKVLGPYYLEATAGRGFHITLATPKKITANTALTVTTSAAIAHSIDVQGFIAP